MKDRIEILKSAVRKKVRDLTDSEVSLIWAVVMIDNLFGGDQEATNRWIDQRSNLSDADLIDSVEQACNLR